MARIRFACERCSHPLGYGEECHCKEAAPSPKQEAVPTPKAAPEFQLEVPTADPPAPQKRGRPKKNKD
jgi:hypothetical protein